MNLIFCRFLGHSNSLGPFRKHSSLLHHAFEWNNWVLLARHRIMSIWTKSIVATVCFARYNWGIVTKQNNIFLVYLFFSSRKSIFTILSNLSNEFIFSHVGEFNGIFCLLFVLFSLWQLFFFIFHAQITALLFSRANLWNK